MAELSRTAQMGLYAAIAALVVACGLVGWRMLPSGEAGISGQVVSRNIGPSIGGDFTLTDADGKTITQDRLRGKAAAIFFGYTHCPDFCPTTLAEMGERLAALGADADKFNVLFVTIDPARDTPQLLRTYMESFDPRIIAATGTQAQIDDITRKFRVYVSKVGSGDAYTMDHSTAVYLLNAKGDLVSILDYHAGKDEAVARMRRALAS